MLGTFLYWGHFCSGDIFVLGTILSWGHFCTGDIFVVGTFLWGHFVGIPRDHEDISIQNTVKIQQLLQEREETARPVLCPLVRDEN